jgi:hypothetical protein
MIVQRKKSKKRPAEAVHAKHQDGVHHLVGIGNLRVFIVRDGQFWFAQGLEIDYAVQGGSVDDAKKKFEIGLEKSIDLNLRMFGNIEKLLVPAPSEVLQEAARNKSKTQVYSQVSLHQVGTRSQQALPFEGISYLIAA